MKRFLFVFWFVLFNLNLSFAQEQPAPLVDAEWLKRNLEANKQVILDVRPAKNYKNGHVPGAVSAAYNIGWRKNIDDLIGMLPPEDEIVSHIRNLGIDNDEHVIILPHGNSSTDFGAATRIYWTFKVLGHNRVSILDGGYKAWNASGGALSTEYVEVIKGTFKSDFQHQLVTDEAQVHQALGSQVELVDARPVAQFKGRAKSPVVARAGTIPNSKNLVQSNLYDAGNASFASITLLETLVRDAGVSENRQTIAFCNTGHWASIAWFALSEIQGRANVSLYDGSMNEWAQTGNNPVNIKQ